jgi:small subunit ribosomal protein S20
MRSSTVSRIRNRYRHKTTRTWLKKVRLSTDKKEATTLMGETFSMLDKMVKKNIIHKNKAANLKSSISKHVNALA